MNMFQHLGHHLFGWQYCSFNFGFSVETRRLRSTPNGTKYVLVYVTKLLYGVDAGYRDWRMLT